MEIEDTYFTISSNAEGYFITKGSKFISYAFPIESELDVKQNLQNLRVLHPSAKHHCYAYRLGLGNEFFRINDDGEPSGTAGKPIYNQLVSQNLSQILVVVVRYFGGTLLGVSGLINAYKEASQDVLLKSNIISKIMVDVYQLNFEYEKLNNLMKLIKDNKLKITFQTIDTICMLQVEIRKSILDIILVKFSKIESLQISYLKSY